MNIYKFERGLSAQSGFNIRLFVVIVSVLLLVSYGIFNARNLIIGPTIEIFSPVRDMETEENILTIKGVTKSTPDDNQKKNNDSGVQDALRDIRTKFGDDSIMMLGDKPHVNVNTIH